MEYVLIAIYWTALACIFVFSVGQLHLTILYKKRKKHQHKIDEELTSYPYLTIQLPIFNELYMVDRLIDAVCAIHYPKSKLEIQILDDSTDETTQAIAEKIVAFLENGFDIQHIRRGTRTGFKAGALQEGLRQSKGEFIAVFDSDFIPSPDFLLKTIPYFRQYERLGMVQTRWGHLNKNYSLLTKLQAFGLDAHFTIEQGGRAHANSFINFNGTGGVWRKDCIIDAGGWSADTLTEDLDLSYRAQLKGWNFQYLEDVESPAELPVLMPAIKSQQFRWNKGAAETAQKLLRTVFKSGKLSKTSKIHALLHLYNSSIFLFLLVAAVTSVPLLYIMHLNPGLHDAIASSGVLIIGLGCITYFYWVAHRSLKQDHSLIHFIQIFPSFLTITMGLSLHNTLAVIQGIVGKKTAFIRTPKFNIIKKQDSWVGNKYIQFSMNWTTLFEGLLTLYFLAGIAMAFYWREFGWLVFHGMLCIGFGVVFIYSVLPAKITSKRHG